jgi:LuxR family maltose regulon positive regulatory protein
VPQLTPLKLLLAEGTSRSLKEAYARLSVLDREMDRLNRKNVRIEVLALLALVCTSQGKVTSAYEHLQAALALGEIGGTIRRFVDLGAPMEDLLLHYRNNYPERNYTEYINQILAAFPKEKLGFQAFEPEANREEILTKQLEIRSLTRRERQILQLLAEDLSTHEIATKLVISPSTLHVHTKNIYRKLDVHKRTEAADLARVMGLV